MSDGFDDLAVISEPVCGLAVEFRNLTGQRSTELQAQEIREKLVVAKPGSLSVERHDEGVGVLQFQQYLLRARAVGQKIGEFAVQPFDERGSQEHALNLARLAFEHLGHQVFANRPVGTRELIHETLGLRMTAERDHRQAEAGRPTFRPPVQRGGPTVGQTDLGRSKQLARIVLTEL